MNLSKKCSKMRKCYSKTQDPLQKDVVEFKKPQKKVDTRTEDQKYNDALSQQTGVPQDSQQPTGPRKDIVKESLFGMFGDEKPEEDKYQEAVKAQAAKRVAAMRQKNFDKGSALTPEILNEVANQVHGHGYHELADAIRSGQMNPHQAADELENLNFHGLGAALRMKGDDDIHTLLHTEKAHNDFDLNGRPEAFDNERDGALAAKYFAVKNHRDTHERLFKPDNKYGHNNKVLDAMLYLHNNGLEDTHTANELTRHIKNHGESYQNLINDHINDSMDQAKKYMTGPDDPKAIQYEKENPGFHQRVADGYMNRVSALKKLQGNLAITPKPKLSVVPKLQKSCGAMRKCYETMKKTAPVMPMDSQDPMMMSKPIKMMKSWKKRNKK